MIFGPENSVKGEKCRFLESGERGDEALVGGSRARAARFVQSIQDILLSWNFKHMVNRRRRIKINEVNVSLGLPNIEIIAPPEI